MTADNVRAAMLIAGLLDYVEEFHFDDNPRETQTCAAGCFRSPPDPYGHKPECKLAKLLAAARSFLAEHST